MPTVFLIFGAIMAALGAAFLYAGGGRTKDPADFFATTAGVIMLVGGAFFGAIPWIYPSL